MPEELIYYGSAVKALGSGKVGGYLVEFTDYDAKKGVPPDLAKEFFTKSTDLDIETGDRRTVYFNHGQDATLKRRKLSKAELKVDEVGVWAETILDTSDQYLAKIYEMVEAGKLGWSSGSLPHLVEKKAVKGGFAEIVTWPIGEASLTHTPCNPFGQAVPLKSFFEGVGEAEQPTAALPSIKGLFQEKLSEQTPSSWQLESVFRDVLRDIANAAGSADITGVSIDVAGKVREAADEYLAALVPLAASQITEYLQGDSREPFYLKSLFDEFIESGSELVSGSDLDSHSQAVVSAVAEFARKGGAMTEPLKTWLARLSDKQKFRTETKAGRVISEANRARIAEVLTLLDSFAEMSKEMRGALAGLHAMGEPKTKAADEEVLNLLANFEAIRMRRTLAAARS